MSAPLIDCMDCVNGETDCPECAGLGYFETRIAGRTVVEPCDACRNGKLVCDTCEGETQFADPDWVDDEKDAHPHE